MQPTAIGLAHDQLADRWPENRFNMQDWIAAHGRALALLSPESGARALLRL